MEVGDGEDSRSVVSQQVKSPQTNENIVMEEEGGEEPLVDESTPSLVGGADVVRGVESARETGTAAERRGVDGRPSFAGGLEGAAKRLEFETVLCQTREILIEKTYAKQIKFEDSELLLGSLRDIRKESITGSEQEARESLNAVWRYMGKFGSLL